MENTESNKINIENIMQEIRETIKERHYSKEALSFNDISGGFYTDYNEFNMDMFENDLSDINNSWQIPVYRPIYSEKKFIGGLIVFTKRIIRKFTKFYIVPFVEEQNNFNSDIVKCLNSVHAYINSNEQDNKIKNLESVLNKDIKNAMLELVKTNNDLSNEIQSLKQQLEDLRKNTK